MKKMLPLDGIQILELSRLLPGPWCSMMLSDFGADVIKVEQPGIGDYSRTSPPFVNGESIYFLHVNRNKKSIALNLKSSAGREVFLKLAKKADVIIEAYSPGKADKMGIGYKAVSKINPGIIYCSITGFGQTGPYRDIPGHDAVMVGISGFYTLFNKGHQPSIQGFQLADYAAAAMATAAIPMALLARVKTGRGQLLDISMLDGSLSWLFPGIAAYLANSYGLSYEEANAITAPYGQSPRYNIYPTKDGNYLVFACLEKHFWQLFCNTIGREDLFDDQETAADRLTSHGTKQDYLFSELRKIFLTKNRDTWFEELRQAGVPCAPVYDLPETFNDPHVLERKMLFEMDHPTLGKIKQVGNPIKMSETAAFPSSPPPILGEHTTQVLQEFGFSQAEIAGLYREKIVAGT